MDAEAVFPSSIFPNSTSLGTSGDAQNVIKTIAVQTARLPTPGWGSAMIKNPRTISGTIAAK